MKKLALLLTLVAAGVMAETSSEKVVEGSSSTGVVSVKTEEKILGTVEVRPSWKTNSGEFHTENTLEGGFQFNKDRSVGYTQYIDSNLYNPANSVNGAGVIVQDGFFNAQLKNLWNNGNGLSLSYEPRVYLPTNAGKRDAGMITMIRNNLTLRQQFSSLFALNVVAIPMIHAYSKSGSLKDGAETANPVFEQRFYLVGEFSFTDKLSLAVPLMLESQKMATHSGAKNSGSWAHTLYAWPELYYAIAPNYMVGAAYMTAPFADSSLSKFDMGSAFANGVPQIILRASL